jgi:regulator of replication initiation timing
VPILRGGHAAYAALAVAAVSGWMFYSCGKFKSNPSDIAAIRLQMADVQKNVNNLIEQNKQLMQAFNALMAENADLRKRLGDSKDRDAASMRKPSATAVSKSAANAAGIACGVACAGFCYGVQRGDTISALALRFYKDAGKFRRIADANNIPSPDYALKAESCICIPGVKVPPVTRSTIPPKARPRPPTRRRAVIPSSPHAEVRTYRQQQQQRGEQQSQQQQVTIQPQTTQPRIEINVQQQQQQQQQAPPQPPPPAPQQPPAEKPPAPTSPQPPPSAEPAPPPQAAIPPVTPRQLPPPVAEKKISEGVILPGSAWVNAGNVSPTEKGNVITNAFVEQGVTLWKRGRVSFVPYVSATAFKDTKGFDWNNRFIGQAGLKMALTFSKGIVQVGGSYGEEYRFKTGNRYKSPIGYANYWLGWDLPTRERPSRRFLSAFPGSSWGMVGNISPAEKDNVIGMAYLQQGVTLVKPLGVSVIPFGEYMHNMDSRGYDWNNRYIYGGGMKLAVPAKTGLIEFGSSWRNERRWQTNRTDQSVTGFVNIWFGWNPKAH